MVTGPVCHEGNLAAVVLGARLPYQPGDPLAGMSGRPGRLGLREITLASYIRLGRGIAGTARRFGWPGGVTLLTPWGAGGVMKAVRWEDTKRRVREIDPDWDAPDRVVARERGREEPRVEQRGYQLAQLRKNAGLTQARVAVSITVS